MRENNCCFQVSENGEIYQIYCKWIHRVSSHLQICIFRLPQPLFEAKRRKLFIKFNWKIAFTQPKID